MGTKVYKRKPDCAHYDECLTECGKNSKPLRCCGCKKYKFQPMEIDPYVNKEETIIYLPDFENMDLDEVFAF